MIGANQLADDAAEAIRGLNHLTRDDGSLRYPSEVYAALGSLSQMLAMLPQAMQQMDALIEGWVAAGHVNDRQQRARGPSRGGRRCHIGLPGGSSGRHRPGACRVGPGPSCLDRRVLERPGPGLTGDGSVTPPGLVASVFAVTPGGALRP